MAQFFKLLYRKHLRHALLPILILVCQTQAFADSPTSDKTFFKNGIYAAGYGDVSAETIPGGDGPSQMGIGASFGFQLIRAFGQAATFGYGASAINGSKSMVYGPELGVALLNDLPINVSATYSPSSGYFKRTERAEDADRYVLFTSTRAEARILVQASHDLRVGVVLGSTTVETEAKYEEEKKSNFNGGTFYGLCLRTTKM